jgi:hypothetical protein
LPIKVPCRIEQGIRMSEPRAESSAAAAAPAPQVHGETGGQSLDSTAPIEIGGRDGPEPVRYGDWEKNGRCIDF